LKVHPLPVRDVAIGAPGRGPPSSLGTIALVLVFALLGTGAALLAGRAPTIVTGASHGIIFSLPRSIWAVLFLGPLLVGFTAYIIRWAITSPAGVPARVGVSVAVAALVAALLVGMVLDANWNGNSTVSIGSTGSGPGLNGTGPGHNSTAGNGTYGYGTGGGTGNTSGNGTGPGGPGNGSSGSGNSSRGGGNTSGGGGHGGGQGTGNNSTGAPLGATPASGITFGVSNLVFLFVSAGLSAVVAVLALPGILARLVDRRPRRAGPPVGAASPVGPPGPAEVRTALRDATLAIEAGETPRDSIVRLYGRLLGRVAPGSQELTTATAEEIQRTQFAELQVPAERSEQLTEIFEEACYSSHLILQADADRFVETMRAIERDLFLDGTPE